MAALDSADRQLLHMSAPAIQAESGSMPQFRCEIFQPVAKAPRTKRGPMGLQYTFLLRSAVRARWVGGRGRACAGAGQWMIADDRLRR